MMLDAISRGDEIGRQDSQGHEARQGPRGDGGKRPRLAAPSGDCRMEGLVRRQVGEKQ